MIIQTAELKRALTAAKRTAGVRSSIPIIACVRLQATGSGLVLSTTDLEVSRMQRLEAEQTSEQWETCVKLVELAGAMPKKTKDSPTVDLSAVGGAVFRPRPFRRLDLLAINENKPYGDPMADGPDPHSWDPKGPDMEALRKRAEADYPPPLGRMWQGELSIKGAADAILATLDPEDFPTLPSQGNVAGQVVFAGDDWANLIAKVLPSISREESCFQLAGARFELNGRCRAIATDGHTLHLAESELFLEAPKIRKTKSNPHSLAFEGLVPRAVLHPFSLDSFVKKLGPGRKRSHRPDVRLSWSEHHGWLETPGIRYTFRLLEGTFPDYDRVIVKRSKTQVHIETTAAELIRCATGAAAGCGDNSRTVRLDIQAIEDATPDVLFATLTGADGNGKLAKAELNGATHVYMDQLCAAWCKNQTGAETKDCPRHGVKGEPEWFRVGLNPDYLNRVVSAFPADDVVRLDMEDASSPCLVTFDSDPTFRAVIMPVRL